MRKSGLHLHSKQKGNGRIQSLVLRYFHAQCGGEGEETLPSVFLPLVLLLCQMDPEEKGQQISQVSLNHKN